ncbi:MAG: hypothetical protein WBL40_04110 [Terrimicrobiaceae bacterium]
MKTKKEQSGAEIIRSWNDQFRTFSTSEKQELLLNSGVKKALDDMWASSTSLEKRWAMLSAIEEYVTALRNEVEETICE